MIRPTAANVLEFGERPRRAFERRRHRRLPVPHIRSRPEGGRLEILDMSPRGMAVKTRFPFAPGATYLFELFDKGRSLMVEGEICWSLRQPDVALAASAPPPPVYHSGVSFVGVQLRATGPTVSRTMDLPLPVESASDAEELIADRIARLRSTTNPDDAAELLLDLLSGDFEHLVLFRIASDRVHAWLGRGPTLVPERLMRLSLDLERVAILRHLKEGGTFYYGLLPSLFADLQLLRCWEGELSRECVLFPIRLKGRLVALLYADVGGASIDSKHLGSLKAATELFAVTLLNQILKRKRNPSSGGQKGNQNSSP